MNELCLEKTECFSGQVHLWLTAFSDFRPDDFEPGDLNLVNPGQVNLNRTVHDLVEFDVANDIDLTNIKLTYASFTCVLSPEELQRSQKFLNSRDAQRYIAAHGVLRHILSRYAPISPQEWKFKTNHYGKPVLRADTRSPDLYFSLSYTDKYFACAISHEPVIGLDLEKITPTEDLVNQIQRYCSPEEQQILKSLTVHQRQRQFFKLWTLKEAFVKARGIGLVYPIRALSFDLSDELSICVSVDDEPATESTHWYFELYPLEEDHFVSVAVQNKRGRFLCY